MKNSRLKWNLIGGNDVSSEVYNVYDLICIEQGESKGQEMQM